MLVHDNRRGRQFVVEFTGRTPAAAGPETFQLDPAGGAGGDVRLAGRQGPG